MVSQQLRCVGIARLVGTEVVTGLFEAMADPTDLIQERDWGMVVGCTGRFGEESGLVVGVPHAETAHDFGPYQVWCRGKLPALAGSLPNSTLVAIRRRNACRMCCNRHKVVT